ncbi:pyroglutamyl-peptidase [Neomicrococcus aestuarii]|uniref:Pyroglutamyl-peptidase I n=1 Tax=Neomicrococcus aestuarii TaxID=556325 RepID=A0A7W8TRY3_9MICC|nr:pyroglutamyl-peptidase I [Neomicrococcus aestuarii]MBB5511658.1 pyroglutamyl-peptidase [Neomicrococcus aestuarii]
MILLTGFEPFGDHSTNPSAEAVRLAAEVLSQRGIRARAEILPVTFEGSSMALEHLVKGSELKLEPEPGRERDQEQARAQEWELIVCVGVAGGRDKVSLERVAINVDDARIPDNDGAAPVDEPIVPDGPAAYFSRLPLKRGLLAIQDTGVPVEVSNSAGTYVCNHVFYELMHLLRDRPAVPAGFVHVPVAENISEQDAARAIVALVETTLAAHRAQLDDVKVTAGTED